MSEEASEGLAARLPEMKWGTVRTPGCYLVTETGRLVRMTLDAIYDPDVLLSLGATDRIGASFIKVNPAKIAGVVLIGPAGFAATVAYQD